MRLAVAGLVMAVVISGCGGSSSTAAPTARSAVTVSESETPDLALRVPISPPEPNLSEPARQYAAITDAFNKAMASIPVPERTVEQLTAAYGMQAAIMAEFVDSMETIDWPSTAEAHACDLVALARVYQFYDAALSRAPSMSVIETLESDRDAATTEWQATIDDLAFDLLPKDLRWIARSLC